LPTISLCKILIFVIFQESAAFFARTGLGEVPQVVVNGYPLKKEELKGEFEETVVSTILRQTGELQKAVYNVSVCYDFCFLLSFCYYLFNVINTHSVL